MVEKMTAVWLIMLTILVCAGVPAVLMWLTTPPNVVAGLDLLADLDANAMLYHRSLL